MVISRPTTSEGEIGEPRNGNTKGAEVLAVGQPLVGDSERVGKSWKGL